MSTIVASKYLVSEKLTCVIKLKLNLTRKLACSLYNVLKLPGILLETDMSETTSTQKHERNANSDIMYFEHINVSNQKKSNCDDKRNISTG